MNNKVIIITGNKGVGKTTKLLNIIGLLKSEGVNIVGFTAACDWNNGERNEYRLVDVNSDKSITLCTIFPDVNYEQSGRFYFNPTAVQYGKKLLTAHSDEKLVIIIDEVGPFELDNKVWHSSLIYQLESTQNIILISVRKNLVNNIINKYKLKNVAVYSIDEPDLNIIKEINLTI